LTFNFAFNVYFYIVQFLAKSVNLFRITRFCKNKYLTFEIDLWLWSQSHKMLFYYLALYGYYIVQFLAKSIKTFRFYCKMKYLTFDFDLWPWGQSHTILICSMLSNWVSYFFTELRNTWFRVIGHTYNVSFFNFLFDVLQKWLQTAFDAAFGNVMFVG